MCSLYRYDIPGTLRTGAMFLTGRLAVMPVSLPERAAHYRDYAADLRRLADRTWSEFDRKKLLQLAKQFDCFAESIERVALTA